MSLPQQDEFMSMQKSGYLIASITLALAMILSLPALAETNSKSMRKNFVVSERNYALPAIELHDQNGAVVDVASLRDSGQRTIISFIFTSCAGICPMITANVNRSVPELERIEHDFRIVLITVDPEHDTPERLAAYAERFRTDPKIRFLTGSREQVFGLLRDLEALYEGSNKMNHQPVTLISSGSAQAWRRIDGLIGSDTLVEQYREVVEHEREAG